MKPTVHPFQTDDPRLRAVHEKVLAKLALDHADVVALFASKDVLAIGWLANFVRERMHESATRYVVNELGESGDEFVVLGSEPAKVLHRVESLRKEHAHARISALTVEEVADRDTLAQELRKAGADALIGGAMLFHPAVRARVWKSASTSEQRAKAREAAAAAGLEVPLYLVQRGATANQAAGELLSFRAHQAETFSSISYPADATTSLNQAATTGMQEMKHIAIARLALPNVAHIRVYWQMLGGKLAQIGLRFGASELDGSSLQSGEDAAARAKEAAREIAVAGREPQEMKAAKIAIVSA